MLLKTKKIKNYLKFSLKWKSYADIQKLIQKLVKIIKLKFKYLNVFIKFFTVVTGNSN